MALVIPPGYAQAAFVYSGTTGTPEFVTTVGVALTEWGGDFQGAANRLHEMWGEYVMDRTSTRLTLNHVALAVGQDGGGTGSVISTASPYPGGLSGANGPLVMSVLMQKQTTRLGRSGRGRSFIPGLLASNDVLEGGQVAEAARSNIEGDLQDLFTVLANGTETEEPIYGVLLHDDSISGPTSPDLFSGISVAPLVGIQRKRIR